MCGSTKKNSKLLVTSQVLQAVNHRWPRSQCGVVFRIEPMSYGHSYSTQIVYIGDSRPNQGVNIYINYMCQLLICSNREFYEFKVKPATLNCPNISNLFEIIDLIWAKTLFSFLLLEQTSHLLYLRNQSLCSPPRINFINLYTSFFEISLYLYRC